MLEDVLDGYVSAPGARDGYAVVFGEDGRSVDEAATGRERETRRRARFPRRNAASAGSVAFERHHNLGRAAMRSWR